MYTAVLYGIYNLTIFIQCVLQFTVALVIFFTLTYFTKACSVPCHWSLLVCAFCILGKTDIQEDCNLKHHPLPSESVFIIVYNTKAKYATCMQFSAWRSVSTYITQHEVLIRL